MKRAWVWLLVCALVVGMPACAKKSNPRKTYDAPKTVEEYLERAQSINRAYSEVPPVVLPKDTKIIDLPAPYLMFVKYNSPPGTRELDLTRLVKERQVSGPGVVSSDITRLVYSVVYYYPDDNRVGSELYLIPLDTSLPDKKRVSTAYLSKRVKKPLIAAGMGLIEKNMQKTLTVVDFSKDGKRIAVKEKSGSRVDGLWKTELWIYDFDSVGVKRFDGLRKDIRAFWLKKNGVNLDEYRWDIYPLGWDAADDRKILVYAYGYTGERPVFLGTWSVDAASEAVSLKSLTGTAFEISANGLILNAEIR